MVDSGASMHMLSRKDQNSAELETIQASRNPATVITANGKCKRVRKQQCTSTVQILGDTPAVLSLEKLCEEHGYSHEWANGQKPHLKPKWLEQPMQHGELCADCCPRIIGRFFQLECKYVFNIGTAGHI